MTRAVQSVTKQKKHHKGRKKGLSVLKSSNGPDLTMSVWSPTVWAAYVRQVIADVRNQYREIQDLFPEDALETYTRLFARVTGAWLCLLFGNKVCHYPVSFIFLTQVPTMPALWGLMAMLVLRIAVPTLGVHISL